MLTNTSTITKTINNYYLLSSSSSTHSCAQKTPFNNNNINNDDDINSTKDKLFKITKTSSFPSSSSSCACSCCSNINNINSNHNNNHSTFINTCNNKILNKKESSIQSYYFYTNTRLSVIENKFIMSYEEQLHRAILKGNFELCHDLVEKYKCDLNLIVYRRLPLALACEYNYYDLVELFLKNGANVNQSDFFDQTCLLYAINSADLNLIHFLVQNKSNVNQCDSNGIYPIHLAISRKNDEICDFLLDCGAQININDKQGTTPLSLAISNEYLYMIHKLIDSGAEVNQNDSNGDSPLIKCIWSTNIDTDELLRIMSKLLTKGAEINYKNKTGRSALYTAVYQNNTRVALYLMEQGAACDDCSLLTGNFTLLHYSCFQGNLTLTKALIERNLNVNSTSDNNETPVYIATTKGHVEIIELLVRHGANVNIFAGSENDNKCTPLQAAVYYISSFDLFKTIVDILLMGSANLACDMPGPILILCLQYNKYNFAKYLLANGALVNQRTIFNQSCLYKAFLSRNLEFLSMCINAGYNLRDDTWIEEYLSNPNFIDFPEYYFQERTIPHEERDSNEMSRLLDEEEYFSRRYRSTHTRRSCSFNLSIKNDIHELLKHYFSNPLSLKQLSRIRIRRILLRNNKDFKIKWKILYDLQTQLPKRLLDYLLFNEFF